MMQEPNIRTAIQEIGAELTPTSLKHVLELFDDEQHALLSAHPVSAADIAYGPHERHRLDLYAPTAATGPVPIMVWVHGGGFVRGDKGGGKRWPDANGGRIAAQAGFLGVVVNYRLAPQDPWPAGAEDLERVVAWLKGAADKWQADPKKIVVVGTSAGAAHIAGYLKRCPEHREAIAGAVLMSGVFGVTEPADMRDISYYGDNARLYPDRVPLDALIATSLPLLIAVAEFDPPRFQMEFISLLQGRLGRHGRLPRSLIVSGHNHFSLPYHLGTSDRRTLDEIVAFAREVCA